MKIWIVELAEPLPIEEGSRLMRCGQLAAHLSAAGHDVTWWTSSFSHIGKTPRNMQGTRFSVATNYALEFLESPGYRRNISLARIRSHIASAREFARRAERTPRPEIILAALPTLEVCEAVIDYGRRHHVPVVTDLRDKWPDAFVSFAAKPVRPLARLFLAPEFRRLRRICRGATALFAVSHDYLEWGLANAGRAKSERDAVFVLGYDHETAAPASAVAALETTLGITPDHFVVCFIGAFGATYDLDPVINAARLAAAAGDARLRFVLAGDGPESLRWRHAARGLPNVVFPGWCSAAQIAALLTRADVGLAAYRREAPQSLPNKPFEYFAGGLPVISTLEGELAVLLESERVGMTCEAGDAKQLLDAICRLAADRALTREMGQRARRLAEGPLSTRHIVPEMARALERIARDVRTAA